MKNKFGIAGLIALIFVASIFLAVRSVVTLVSSFSGETERVRVGDDIFSVRVSDTESEREKGLSGSAPLEKNEGMLFVYDSPVIPTFWMKDMKFPIDIIWISKGRVVGWVTDLDPQRGASDSELRRYLPGQPIDSALEVPSGTVLDLDITLGDLVSR